MTERRSGQDRRRGRPPENKEPGSTLSAWVPVSVHERAVQQAKAQRVSVSEFVLRAVQKACA
jgi:predicted HicB family RNase H-like nuclease